MKKLISDKMLTMSVKKSTYVPIEMKTGFKCKIKKYGECYCIFGQVNNKKLHGLARLITADGQISEGQFTDNNIDLEMRHVLDYSNI